MLEITGEQISKLSASALRALVRRLCEADVRGLGLPLSSVTAGGDDSSSDGGIDVRVRVSVNFRRSHFIPRASTGFQVRVSDVLPSGVHKEMCPKGRVRRSIASLAADRGAYIIVAGGTSAADDKLQRRLQKMKAALAGVRGREALELDFYDRERLATWVRCYPGVAAWLRREINEPLSGWTDFVSRSARRAGQAPYLIDDIHRMHDGRNLELGPRGIADGIASIREVLSRPRGVARLVGLSGTGKTRLAQALFEESVLEDPLPAELGIYGDLADDLLPGPSQLIASLVADSTRAIIVVDNCPAATHRTLAEVCSRLESRVSLLTIEFDMQDDDPEGTDVFWLDSASEGLVGTVLESRAPRLSAIDRRRIAEQSGGNLRLALVLAHSHRRSKSTSDLADADLFSRLFQQRRGKSDSLERTAEACSLVYSLDTQPKEIGISELEFVAQLAEQPAREVTRNLTELGRRELLQRRGRWVAVLPHAMANHLAKLALENHDPLAIADRFYRCGNERLLRSFSRRLSFLHDSEGARNIARTWLEDGAPFGDLRSPSQQVSAVFRNIVPLAPEAALLVFERLIDQVSASNDSDLRYRASTWTSTIAAIAFDAGAFRPAVDLLARLALEEPTSHWNARRVFGGLFQLLLSGTHAHPVERLSVANDLLASADLPRRRLGVLALHEMLEAWHFTSHTEPSLGARTRDYGWRPTGSEALRWYREAIARVTDLAVSGNDLAEGARSALAEQFRGLWVRAGAYEELEIAVRRIVDHGLWRDGLAAVRSTLKLDSKTLPPPVLERLTRLEALLRPRSLLGRARACLHKQAAQGLGLVLLAEPDDDEDLQAAMKRSTREIREIAATVFNTPRVLGELLADPTEWDPRTAWAFGAGLAAASDEARVTWDSLGGPMLDRDPNGRVAALRGFIHELVQCHSVAADPILDSAVSDSALGRYFPLLQSSVSIDGKALSRLNGALAAGIAPIDQYANLGLGGVIDDAPPTDLAAFIVAISAESGGSAVAIHLLNMFLHGSTAGSSASDEIVECGRTVAQRFDFPRHGHDADYDLSVIIGRSFRSTDAREAARVVCRRLVESRKAYNYQLTVRALMETQCEAVLDELLLAGETDILRDSVGGRTSPIDCVPSTTLLAWAQAEPETRFRALAEVVTAFSLTADALQWTTLGLRLIDDAPRQSEILEIFARRIMFCECSGSFADHRKAQRALTRALFAHNEATVVAWARELDCRLASEAVVERSQEREREESFE